jgi:hypothetical protein
MPVKDGPVFVRIIRVDELALGESRYESAF